jgi:hypothetical protein
VLIGDHGWLAGKALNRCMGADTRKLLAGVIHTLASILKSLEKPKPPAPPARALRAETELERIKRHFAFWG